MSDIKIKIDTNELTLKTKMQILPMGYIKPTGTLEINEAGEYDVTRYAKVIINLTPTLANAVYALDENGNESQVIAVDENGQTSQVIYEEVI